jgi:hypothetical protein
MAHLGDTDKMWENITPAHGIVALDHIWAAQKHLPASMNLPSDYDKGVYIIDAYHQLHCLVPLAMSYVVRNTDANWIRQLCGKL